jgi:tetratricopeptide (TPR) repeat protein
MLYYHRDFIAAEQAIARALAFDQTAPGSWAISGRIAEAFGRLDEARRHTDRAVDLAEGDGVPALLRIQQLRLQALTGEPAPALEGLRLLRRESEARGVLWNPHFDASIFLAIGDDDRALTSLEEAIRLRHPSVLWAAVDPRLDAIRSYPRFPGILRSLGLE